MHERPVLRRRPPPVMAAIRSVLREREEIGRDELRAWARERRLITDDDLGAKHLKDALFRLRERGEVDYDRRRVWVGRNPERAGKLSRKINAERRRKESTLNSLISELVQVVSLRRMALAPREARHEALAR